MSADLKELRKYTFYVCGQCGDKQYHLVNEEPEIPCPDCGWYHKERKKYDVPGEIRVDLSQF